MLSLGALNDRAAAVPLRRGDRAGPLGFSVANRVDYVVRPVIFRRWADIHPMVTLIGALAGVSHFGYSVC